MLCLMILFQTDRKSGIMVESLVLTDEEPFQIEVQEWFSKRNQYHDSGDGGEQHAVFNVLDNVLVCAMERLKKLRLFVIFLGVIIALACIFNLYMHC